MNSIVLWVLKIPPSGSGHTSKTKESQTVLVKLPPIQNCFGYQMEVNVALVVVSYPRIPKADYSWIQSVRAQNDAQFKIIAPHFTLVFPCRLNNQPDLINHIRATIKGIPPIPFLIKKVVAVKDRLSENIHLFLIPESGLDDIVKLHDMLYTGILASELNRDVPFIPHITIANSLDPARIQNLAAEINARQLFIKGTLDSLAVVSFDGKLIDLLGNIPLDNAQH